jgi:GTPase SAR1 family protein
MNYTFLLLGPESSGKTTFLSSHSSSKLLENFNPTILSFSTNFGILKINFFERRNIFNLDFQPDGIIVLFDISNISKEIILKFTNEAYSISPFVEIVFSKSDKQNSFPKNLIIRENKLISSFLRETINIPIISLLQRITRKEWVLEKEEA